MIYKVDYLMKTSQGQSKKSSPYELDGICNVVHIIAMWAVNATDEYLEWFGKQTAESKEALLVKVFLLEEFGPQLGRPHADLEGKSDQQNLKELRARTPTQVLLCSVLLRRQATIASPGWRK
jgi:hypothetical protein